MNENRISCIVKPKRQFFPKNKKINSGDFGILAVEMIKEIEGIPQVDDTWGTITIKGNMPELDMMEEYKVIAELEEKSTYTIINMRLNVDLDTQEGKRLFLSMILSNKQLKELYKSFADPFEIINNEDVESLCKVKGIATKTAIKIIKRYRDNIDYSVAYQKLNKYGLSQNMIKKLCDKYKSPDIAISKIEKNPYILIDEVDGIGWGRADEIALKSGISEDSYFRVEAFIKYTLEEEANKGNSWVRPIDMLQHIKENLIDIDNKTLKRYIDKMYYKNILWNDRKIYFNNILIKEKDYYESIYNEDNEINCGEEYINKFKVTKTSRIALKKYHDLELKIAKELKRIFFGSNYMNYSNWQTVVSNLENKQGWCYTSEQKEAIKDMLDNQIGLLTANAGGGKTTTVKGVVKTLNKYKISQCALAGRASARMTEVTGEEGSTIHRLLEYNPMDNKFSRNKENPLDTNIVLLDECSMIGGYLFYDLLKAIPTGAKLILIGDDGQLEAIGACNIFKDLLDCDLIKTSRLTKIHRQAEDSGIITTSLDVRKGKSIIDKDFEGEKKLGLLGDLEMHVTKQRENVEKMILNSFKEFLPLVDNIMDLQVIVPLNDRGKTSCYELNKKIQNIYNPIAITKKECLIHHGKNKDTIFREGDKIINRKNNYKEVLNENGKIIPIFNGDMGIIKEINETDAIITINFERTGDVYVPLELMEKIFLAYAITTHSSQGSEFKYVIYGLDYSHYVLLNREQVYTGITRAKKLCRVCTENKAFRYACKTSSVSTKQTFLKELLNEDVAI